MQRVQYQLSPSMGIHFKTVLKEDYSILHVKGVVIGLTQFTTYTSVLIVPHRSNVPLLSYALVQITM